MFGKFYTKLHQKEAKVWNCAQTIKKQETGRASL